MLNQLEHSGIPKFIDFQHVSGQSILMMERAPGINLEQLSRQTGKLEPRLILKIAAQMSNILLYLRRQSESVVSSLIVHGDIKPSYNV
jgi:non-specific serine/threonine protein kinase